MRVDMSPIGPSPSTTTVPPRGIAAYSTACHAVGSTSDRYTYRSSDGPSGTLMWVNCAWGTRRYSACPPGTWPYIFEYPNRAAPAPYSRTWVVSHCVYSCWSHMKQAPHDTWNGMTTRSPRLRAVISEPTSSTTPIASWPRMSPRSRNAPRVSYRCRSEPQMLVVVTRMIASVGSSIFGSGTSSTRTSRLPCQVTAFIPPNSPRSVGLIPSRRVADMASFTSPLAESLAEDVLDRFLRYARVDTQSA